MPASTPLSGLGSADCEWCGRRIHRPATPCFEASPDILLALLEAPRKGSRCIWELKTRGITREKLHHTARIMSRMSKNTAP